MKPTLLAVAPLYLFLMAVPALADPAPEGGVTHLALAPRHELALDLTPFAGFVSYAHQTGRHTQVGAGVGLGFDIASFVPRPNRDSNQGYSEIVPVALFIRRHLPLRFQAEAGLRGSYGAIRDMLDEAGRRALYGAGYASLFWGGPVFQVGSRVSAGLMSGGEGKVFVITPIMLRLSTR